MIIVNRELNPLPTTFRKFCFDRGLKYIDLSLPLSTMREDGNHPKLWEISNRIGHWNQEAHQVIGVEIAKELDKVLKQKPAIR